MKIHITGHHRIDEIIKYNKERSVSPLGVASFFPLWLYLPDFQLLYANDQDPDPEAILLVVNLDRKTWDTIQYRLPKYKRTILVQVEAKIGWELAYEKAELFDYFINFDPSQSSHPNFRQIHIPYDPKLPSSGRDKRGKPAFVNQWRSSRKLFIETYLLRFFPRKRKGVLISTLNPGKHYLIRKIIADKYADEIDVFGGGWPITMPNYCGYASSKVDLLRRYRYCLVMENQRQNGYITEKLLDCFTSTTIPIYWGAQDIHSYPELDWVPIFNENSYDLQKMFNDDRLYFSLRHKMIQNRKAVFDSFSINHFMNTICNVIKSQ